MKAAFIERHGGPEVLQFGEMPDPVAASGEVVVDIVAASVNGADWKVREGKSGQLSRFPYILGRDFSGVVSVVGEGVRDLRVGDEVFGVCDVGQEGAYAEKIAIKAAIVARKTDRLSHVDAAALALAGLTAICTVEDTLKLKAGETILIQGGAGGVASFAIQLAKHLGARVITTASAANHDYLRQIGADEIVDYNAVDFTKAVSGCDAVFDTVGGDVAQPAFGVGRLRGLRLGVGQLLADLDRLEGQRPCLDGERELVVVAVDDRPAHRLLHIGDLELTRRLGPQALGFGAGA